MSKRVRRRRGTQAQHDEFTGADGELTVNTTDYRVHAHDGSTAGGFPTAREDEVLHQDQNLSDVDSASSARSNLGLGSAATQADTRYAHRSNNLSDVDSASSARSNLGLTNTATLTYASQVVELGGDFDAGEEVRCERIGNWVTITGIGALSHTLGTSARSTNPIPSQFRPSHNVQNVYESSGNDQSAIQVETDGDILTFYTDKSDGSDFNKTGTGLPPVITYLIT